MRQRINRGTSVTIPTTLKTIEAYEEVNRLLAGRIDIVEFVERIRESFAENRMNAIYTTFVESVEGLPSAFKQTGTFAEDKMNDIIEHVEASTGGDAIILGTKSALANVVSAVVSDTAKERYNQMGFYGVFNGTPMLRIRQAHKYGTYDFAISNNDIWVVSANTKPIKFVTEGDAIFETGDIMRNADRTIDIFAGERWESELYLINFGGQYVLP